MSHELLDFGKWTPFIIWCYVITAVILVVLTVVAYRKEHRLLREIARKQRRESRGTS
jgi:heme exporter protein CcmD